MRVLIGYLWGVNFERDWTIDRLKVTFINSFSRFYYLGSNLTKYVEKKKNVIGQIRTRDLKTIPKAELKSVIVPNISPNILISITIIDF